MRLIEACRTILECEEERQQTAVESVYRPVITPLFRAAEALSGDTTAAGWASGADDAD